MSSSSSPSAGSKRGLITLSSDDEQEASRWKRSSLGGSKPNVITLSSSDDEQEASRWKRSSLGGSKPNVITLSSSDDEQEASRWKRSSLGGSKPNVITLSSSDDKQEERSWKRSSSAGSKSGAVVLTSDDDYDGELLANCRKRRPSRNVAWVFHDEVSILTALADELIESRRLPTSPSAILRAIRCRFELKRQNPTEGDVAKKVHNLKHRFSKVIASGGPSGELRDRQLYDLSVKVWPKLLPSVD